MKTVIDCHDNDVIIDQSEAFLKIIDTVIGNVNIGSKHMANYTCDMLAKRYSLIPKNYKYI